MVLPRQRVARSVPDSSVGLTWVLAPSAYCFSVRVVILNVLLRVCLRNAFCWCVAERLYNFAAHCRIGP